MYGEVVVTRPNKRVLDIGLKVAPGKIRCRNSGHPTDGKWYGGSIETLSNFKPTGDQMDEDCWDKITRGESTERVCEILNIPYVFEEDDEDHRTMFDEIRKMLDRYDEISHKEVIDESDSEWIDDYEFNMAKALNKELPSCSKIAKLLCIMRDNEVKIQIK